MPVRWLFFLKSEKEEKEKFMYKTLILSLAIAFVMCGTVLVKAQSDAPQTKDKKLKIIKKPVPFTGGKCGDAEGTTTVRATFDKSGKVTAAELVKTSACDYFDRNALEKARQIKFEPEVKDGEPITVTKMIVYKFRRM